MTSRRISHTGRGTTRRMVLAAGALALAPSVLRAQSQPPIRIIVGVAAGGLTDSFARAYGEFLGRAMGRTVVVENRPGASGGIAAQATKAAPADGNTLLFTISTTFFGNRVLQPDLPYDPDRDFKVISIVPAGHLPLIVRADLPIRNVADLLAYAQTRDVSLGTYGAGSFPHLLTGELNKRITRRIEPVHYRGEAPMWQDLAGGSLHAACGTVLAATSVLDSNRGRPIAVPTDRRARRLPDVPTFREQGFTDPVFDLTAWVGMFASSGTPEPLIERYADLMMEASASEGIVRLRHTHSIDLPAIPRRESQALYEREGPVWVQSVRALNITPS